MEIVNWKRGLDEMLSCKLKHNSAVHTPKQIIRFDKGNPNHNESDHVHFKGGSALNRNGTWCALALFRESL